MHFAFAFFSVTTAQFAMSGVIIPSCPPCALCALSVCPLLHPPPVPGFLCYLMSNTPVIFHFICLTSTFYANLDTFVDMSSYPFTNITAYNHGLEFFCIFVLFSLSSPPPFLISLHR